MEKKLQVYDLQFSEDDEGAGFTLNSIVDIPAHRMNLYTFNAEPQKMKFSFDDEKRIAVGVAILADTPIYRNNKTLGEHYVVFSSDTVRRIATKALKDGLTNNLTFDHNDSESTKGGTMVLSVVLDESNGITAPDLFKGQSITDGSWILGYHFEDVATWNKVKAKGGFSVEGWFAPVLTNKTIKVKKQNLVQQFMKMVFNEDGDDSPATFENTATTAEGVEVFWNGDLVAATEDAPGTEVFVMVEGVSAPAPDGVHTFADGLAITVENGVVSAMETPAPDEVANEVFEQFAEVVKRVRDEAKAEIANLKSTYEAKFSAQDAKIEALTTTVNAKGLKSKTTTANKPAWKS